MNYELREPTDADIAYLSWNLRASDVKEVYATCGHLDILRALEISTRNSPEVTVGIGDGKARIIFGIKPYGANSALIWALATPEIKNYRTAFLRLSRQIIKGWFEDYPEVHTMFNFTHADNHTHQRWLKWCSAELLPVTPWGALGELFHPFVIHRGNYV